MTGGPEPDSRRKDVDDRNSLALVVFCAALGVLLILRTESTDDLSARVAPIGYLLVLVAGWLALERVAGRVSWIRWPALAARVLLVGNVALFAIVTLGLGGPQFLLVALLIVLLTFSAGVGVVGMLLALLAGSQGRPRAPIGLAATAVVAAIMTNVVIGSTPAPSSPTPTASSQSATPTPSPTPTATPTRSPSPSASGVLLRVNLGGKASGTVRSQPSGIACGPTCEARFSPGTRVSLRPTAQDSMFTGWAQSCSGVGECEVVMRTDNTVTAFFDTPARGFEAINQQDGCSASVAVRPGDVTEVRACFSNSGTTTWMKGTSTEVVLGACCPLGSASVLSAWREGWPSDRVYAQMSQSVVPPGSVGFAPFNVRAPKTAQPGDYRFDGILALASTGAPVAGGAFSIVVTVPPR